MSLIQTVRDLAALARIGLKEGEDEVLAQEIESILKYVSEVKEASGSEVTSGAGALRNIMRDDGPENPPGIYTEAVLAAVPQREGNYVKVKKILN